MSQPRPVDEPLYSLAARLGHLREKVMFIGSAIRELLTDEPDPRAPLRPLSTIPPRFVVILVEAKAELSVEAKAELESLGLVHEQRPELVPSGRSWFVDGDLRLEVISTASGAPEHTNAWYRHALSSIRECSIVIAGQQPISIKVVSSANFVAIRLAELRECDAAEARCALDDVVAVAAGRASMVEEIDRGGAELRSFVGSELTERFASTADGLETQLAGYPACQALKRPQLAVVATRLRRLQRCPTFLSLNDTRRSTRAGGPGATGQTEGPWTFLIRSYEKVSVQRHKPKGVFVAVAARLRCHGKTPGKTGDGRDVCVEDNLGTLHSPNYSATVELRQRRGLSGPYDTIHAEDSFETLWVYDLPRDAAPYRLLLPFDSLELPLNLDAT